MFAYSQDARSFSFLDLAGHEEPNRVFIVGPIVQEGDAGAVVLDRTAHNGVAMLLVEDPLVDWFPGQTCSLNCLLLKTQCYRADVVPE